jgi:hypothetical protein
MTAIYGSLQFFFVIPASLKASIIGLEVLLKSILPYASNFTFLDFKNLQVIFKRLNLS